MNKDISEYTTAELKVMAYDLMVTKEACNENLSKINKVIYERSLKPENGNLPQSVRVEEN